MQLTLHMQQHALALYSHHQCAQCASLHGRPDNILQHAGKRLTGYSVSLLCLFFFGLGLLWANWPYLILQPVAHILLIAAIPPRIPSNRTNCWQIGSCGIILTALKTLLRFNNSNNFFMLNQTAPISIGLPPIKCLQMPMNLNKHYKSYKLMPHNNYLNKSQQGAST